MNLIPIDQSNALVMFMDGGIDELLTGIRAEVLAHTPTTETTKGRAEIASLAHRVSKSKVAIDRFGKELVSDWKTKAKRVDEVRKHARDTLDALRLEVRQPLTNWEEAENLRIAAEKLVAEIEETHAVALLENELWDHRKLVAEQEVEKERLLAEQKAKEEAERAEKERLARDERIRKEAAEQAKKDAEEEAARKAREAAQRVEAERQAILLREAQAKEAAAKAERDLALAKERAKREQEEAVAAAKRAIEEKQAAEKRACEEAARLANEKAENLAHRRSVNNAVVEALMTHTSMDEAMAKSVVKAIATGNISHVSINY